MSDGVGGYTPTTIGTPAGSVFGEAFAATDDGRAVGRYRDPSSGRTRAFFYDGGSSTDLGLLPSVTLFRNARALDINSAGQIVGHVAFVDNPSFGGAAVLWEKGKIFDLNLLIPVGTGWDLLSAEGINEQGQIVGFGTLGGKTRAFVLTPIPASCYADCTGDSTLDIFDFLCFQDAFTTMDPYADCDGSGVLDVFDFLCFQDAYVTGCP
jgi:hypothetical protein